MKLGPIAILDLNKSQCLHIVFTADKDVLKQNLLVTL